MFVCRRAQPELFGSENIVINTCSLSALRFRPNQQFPFSSSTAKEMEKCSGASCPRFGVPQQDITVSFTLYGIYIVSITECPTPVNIEDIVGIALVYWI